MSVLRNVETGKEVTISGITGFGMTVTEDSDAHAKVYTPLFPDKEGMGLVGIESSTPSKFEIDFGPFYLSFDAVVRWEDSEIDVKVGELICAVLKVYKKSDQVLSEKH